MGGSVLADIPFSARHLDARYRDQFILRSQRVKHVPGQDKMQTPLQTPLGGTLPDTITDTTLAAD